MSHNFPDWYRQLARYLHILAQRWRLGLITCENRRLMLAARRGCPPRACYCFVRHGVSGGADRSIIHTPPRSTRRITRSFTLSFSLRLHCSGAPPQIGHSPTLLCRESSLAPSQASGAAGLPAPARLRRAQRSPRVSSQSACSRPAKLAPRHSSAHPGAAASTARGPHALGISPAPKSRSPRGQRGNRR